MKISDNGFSERITTPAPRAPFSELPGKSSGGATGTSNTGSDTLHLSSFASRLQSSSASDSGRSSRVASIAKAVQSNTFTVDPAQISRAMVSEAVGSKAG